MNREDAIFSIQTGDRHSRLHHTVRQGMVLESLERLSLGFKYTRRDGRIPLGSENLSPTIS